MVRIEKLEMQGFKSFAKKTTILFPSNFSVVCGPNGSGKSNILDGVCFVLGRTSAKSLRADRMLEMIFNGGEKKKPAEIAKVSLYFDNSDKSFPLEDETIVLSRKVNRKGVSIYKLNGRTVTRETILEILRSAHIHPDGHNIILQGDVTEVIEMSPNERREIIDEISGVMEFDAKREKAQKELLTVEERLKESAIVLSEREKSIDRLDSERKSAKDYKVLTTELDKLRASLAKMKLEQASSAMKKLEDKISEKSLKDYDEELEKLDKELEELEKKREQITQKLFDRSKDIKTMREVERLKSEINRMRDKIEMTRLEITKADSVIKRLEYLKQRELETSTTRPVKEVLKLNREDVYGTIASLSKVSKEYQTAIEVAAGGHLNDIVVSNENVAIECVNHLKKNKIGRATFLPLDKIKSRNSKKTEEFLNKDGVIDIAINLIDFDKKYHNAFSHIFGNTLVINKIEIAKKLGIGKARFVTLDGDLIERSGAVIGGFYQKKHVLKDVDDVKKYRNEKIKLEKEIKVLEREISRKTKEVEKLSVEEEKGTGQLDKLKTEREKVENKLDFTKKKRASFYEKKVTAQDYVNNLRIKKARLEAELENIKLEFENYKNMETYKFSEDVLKRKISEALLNIKNLGAINMKALEEYEGEKKAYKDLREKVDKLVFERDKVFEVLGGIEGKRKEAFTETLSAVREQFKIVFKDLTGGEGDVKLESDDIESGLLIQASPPGRKILNIDAMSGGEKTLTALAFLFAIQRFRPAPFYILDEIDAALDKTNTKKTVDLIQKYSENAQFIIITHNDATIQAADCVYGVSMGAGESNLVGIRMPS